MGIDAHINRGEGGERVEENGEAFLGQAVRYGRGKDNHAIEGVALGEPEHSFPGIVDDIRIVDGIIHE